MIATSAYLNQPLRSKADMIDDLEWDIVRLGWMRDALVDVIAQHANLQPDYPLIGDATSKAAQQDIGTLEAKIAELHARISALKGSGG